MIATPFSYAKTLAYKQLWWHSLFYTIILALHARVIAAKAVRFQRLPIKPTIPILPIRAIHAWRISTVDEGEPFSLEVGIGHIINHGCHHAPGFRDDHGVGWGTVLGTAALAAVASLLTSLAGIPEEEME